MSLEDALTEEFAERTDAETAARAAQRLAALHEEYEREADAADLAARLADAPYDDFAHAFDWLVGDVAADIEDCTDSREYRLAGYGELAADPEQGA